MRIPAIIVALLLVATAHAQVLLGQEHWPDGTLKYTAYKAGERTHFIRYHANGHVQEVGSYRNGRVDGVWKQYSDSGALLARASFRNGMRQGTWEFRSEADEPLGALHFDTEGALRKGMQYDALGELIAQRAY